MEIDRFLEVRTRIEVDRRFAMGFVTAKAFNAPETLAQDFEAWERKKRPRQLDGGYESDGSDVIALFEQSGLTVVDSTRH